MHLLIGFRIKFMMYVSFKFLPPCCYIPWLLYSVDSTDLLCFLDRLKKNYEEHKRINKIDGVLIEDVVWNPQNLTEQSMEEELQQD